MEKSTKNINGLTEKDVVLTLCREDIRHLDVKPLYIFRARVCEHSIYRRDGTVMATETARVHHIHRSVAVASTSLEVSTGSVGKTEGREGHGSK